MSSRLSHLLVFLLPFLLILPGISGFVYPSADALYSDLVISHYPYALMARQALTEGGLWNPLVLSGTPLAANPLASLFYPPAWLAIAWPQPFIFNLLVALHLGWGGLGLYQLARRQGLSQAAALLAGLGFTGLPKLWAHFGAGHLTLVYTLAWTPWLLLAEVGGKRFATPGVVLGLIALADPRWAAYAGALWLGWSLFNRRDRVKDWLARLLWNLFLAVLLAAPLLVPLMEYTRLSTRAMLQPEDVLTLSLPAARLFGLLFPDFGGGHEWTLYPGVLVLALALLALLAGGRPARFWLIAAGLALVWSLGEALPPLRLIARLPGVALLRVPSRALFAFGICFLMAAALGLDALQLGLPAIQQKRARLLLAGMAIFALVLAVTIGIITAKITPSFTWGALMAVVTAGLLGIGMRKQPIAPVWLVAVLGICLLDWFAIDRSLFTLRPAGIVNAGGADISEYLAAQPGLFRIYSPSYSIPQAAAAQRGLELADGVDPLQLEAYADYMEAASGVARQGYSVTQPPFISGDPQGDNRAARPDPQLLGLLNVQFVAAEFDLPVAGLELVGLFGSTRLYKNSLALPRAWLQAPQAPPGQDPQPVAGLEIRSGQIRITLPENMDQPRRLALAEVIYPGWSAWVDGQPVEIEPQAGLLRSVLVPAGAGEVVFLYRPLSLVFGMGLGLLGILLSAFTFRHPRRQLAS